MDDDRPAGGGDPAETEKEPDTQGADQGDNTHVHPHANDDISDAEEEGWPVHE